MLPCAALLRYRIFEKGKCVGKYDKPVSGTDSRDALPEPMDCVDIGYGRIGTLYIPCLYFGRTSRARYNGDVRRAEDNAVGGSCQRSLFLSVPNIPQHHPPLHAQGVVASGRRLRRETAPDGCRGVRHDADRPAAPDRGPAGHVDDHGGADMYACGHGAGIRCHRFQNLEEQQKCIMSGC